VTEVLYNPPRSSEKESPTNISTSPPRNDKGEASTSSVSKMVQGETIVEELVPEVILEIVALVQSGTEAPVMKE